MELAADAVWAILALSESDCSAQAIEAATAAKTSVQSPTGEASVCGIYVDAP
jgi:hypothetical protein